MTPDDLRSVLEEFLDALPSASITEQYKRALKYELTEGRGEYSPDLETMVEVIDDAIEEEAEKIKDFLVKVDTYQRAKALMTATDGVLSEVPASPQNKGLRDEHNKAGIAVRQAKALVEEQRPQVNESLERIKTLRAIKERLVRENPTGS